MNCLISRAALVSSSSHNCRNCSRSVLLIRISNWLSFLLRFTGLISSVITGSYKKVICIVYTFMHGSSPAEDMFGWGRKRAVKNGRKKNRAGPDGRAAYDRYAEADPIHRVPSASRTGLCED